MDDNVEERSLQNRGAEGEPDLQPRCAWASRVPGPCMGAVPCTDPGTQRELPWGEYGKAEDERQPLRENTQVHFLKCEALSTVCLKSD